MSPFISFNRFLEIDLPRNERNMNKLNKDPKGKIKSKNSDLESQNLEAFIKRKEEQSKVLKKILDSMNLDKANK